MSDWYRYHPGRTTFKGVEVCEYNREGQPDEVIKVVAYAVNLRIAQDICMYLNRQLVHEKTPITKAEPVVGSY